MTQTIKKGILTYRDGVAIASVFLSTGETLSVQNYIALKNAEGFSLEELDTELAAVFGKTAFPAEGAAETPAEPSLKKISIENILNVELAPPSMAVEQLVPEGEVTLLGGHGGAGKTIFALTLAAHFAAGFSWSSFKPKSGRALFVSLEDPAALMKFRLKKIIETYGLSAELVEKNLNILDGSDSAAALVAEASSYGVKTLVRTSLFDELEVAAEGCGLIVMDNASDTFAGDENSRRQVRSFIRELRGTAKKNSAGLILLAHIDKSAARYGANGNSYSGSTAWHNSVRSRLALLEKDDHVELVQEKFNIGKKLDKAIRLTWAEGVLMPDVGMAGGLISEAQQDLDRISVLTAIQESIAAGENVPAERFGSKTTQSFLERYSALPDKLRGRQGRKVFYERLDALQREGALFFENYKTPSRHVARRICARAESPITPAHSARMERANAHNAPNTAFSANTTFSAEEDFMEDFVL